MHHTSIRFLQARERLFADDTDDDDSDDDLDFDAEYARATIAKSRANVILMKDSLRILTNAYPEVAVAIKTQIATNTVLQHQLREIDAMKRHGKLEVRFNHVTLASVKYFLALPFFSNTHSSFLPLFLTSHFLTSFVPCLTLGCGG
jgi:hypothetical protein